MNVHADVKFLGQLPSLVYATYTHIKSYRKSFSEPHAVPDVGYMPVRILGAKLTGVPTSHVHACGLCDVCEQDAVVVFLNISAALSEQQDRHHITCRH